MKQAVIFSLALLALPANADEPSACAVPGHAIQWIADYCMYKGQTDDVIAASPCINEQEKARRGTNSCATKRFYKAALCKMHIADGHRSGTVADCMNDRSFSGNVVREDGAQ